MDGLKYIDALIETSLRSDEHLILKVPKTRLKHRQDQVFSVDLTAAV